MDKAMWRDLEGMFTAIARDAVLLQERLDEAHAAACEEHAHVLAALPPSARAPLLALTPPRLVVDRHEVRCAVRVATTRSLKLEIAVKPIPLGVAAVFRRSESQEMSLCVEIERAFLHRPNNSDPR